MHSDPFLDLPPQYLLEAMLSSPIMLEPTAKEILASAKARGSLDQPTSVQLFVLRRLGEAGDLAVGVFTERYVGMVGLVGQGHVSWHKDLDAVEGVFCQDGKTIIAFPLGINGRGGNEALQIWSAGMRLDRWRDHTYSLMTRGKEAGRPYVEYVRRFPDGRCLRFFRSEEGWETVPWAARPLDEFLKTAVALAWEANGGIL